LRADQRDVLGRVEEAVGCAVQWNKSFAAGHIIEQRLFLLGSDLLDIGVYHEAVVTAEDLGIERRHALGISQLDTALGEDRLELPKTLRRLMVTLITQEQNADFPILLGIRQRWNMGEGTNHQNHANKLEHDKPSRHLVTLST